MIRWAREGDPRAPLPSANVYICVHIHEGQSKQPASEHAQPGQCFQS